MTIEQRVSRADDCEKLIRILADTQHDGLSMDEIQLKTLTPEGTPPWSLSRINDVLCDLRSQVRNEKVRGKSGKKVTKYMLRSTGESNSL
jgi:hypothetical protein